MVQRYMMDFDGRAMPDEEGGWVTYEDYQKLEAELESLRQRLSNLSPDIVEALWEKSRWYGDVAAKLEDREKAEEFLSAKKKLLDISDEVMGW